MVSTVKLSPRIESKLKECLDRHVDRVDSSLGTEVEKALWNWLATYYLIHEDDYDDLPEEDRELIERAIAKQTYEITHAYEKLEQSPAGNRQARKKEAQDGLDDILDELDQLDPDDLRQGIKNAVRESGD